MVRRREAEVVLASRFHFKPLSDSRKGAKPQSIFENILN